MALNNMKELGLVPWPFEDPPSYEPFWFEKNDLNATRSWTREKIPAITIICVLYYIFIWVGPLWMKNREAFKLQKTLVVWNLFLAVFSIMGALRSAPELLGILQKPNGFHRAACVREGLNQPAAFWALAFTLSKIAELGDTVFIVLRKKPLSLLHWFHHLSMVYSTFFLFSEGEPIGRWGGVLNYSVHSIMYTYYTITALQIKLPKKVSMMVTSLQIIQFITGLYVNVYTLWVLASGGECERTAASIKIQLTLGGIYLSLFLKLFYFAYIAKPKTKLS